MRYLSVWCVSLLLAACGGGGGSSGGGSAVAPAVAVTPGSIALTLYPGDSAEARVTGVLASSVTGAVYPKLVDAAGTFREMHFEQERNGSYSGYLVTESTLSVGHHTGKIELHLCRDANCATEFAGSPVALPYDVEVRKGENLTPLSAWNGVADWSTYHGNNAQTGYVPVTLDVSKFSQRWRWSPLIPSGKLGLSTVVTANGKLYASAANVLYAINEHDASVVWTHDFNDLTFPAAGAPAVDGGKVYVMGGQQSSTAMYGFDGATGRQLFVGPSYAQWVTFYAPVVVGDMVASNGGSGSLQVFRTSDGSSPWWASTGYADSWSPASDGKFLYAYNADNNAGALTVTEIATGNAVKSIKDERFQQFAYDLNSAPVLGAAGSVFGVNVSSSRASADAAYAKNRLVNFDVAGGQIKWAQEGVYSSTPAYANGVVYVVNHAPFRLEARAEADGALLWSWTPSTPYQPLVDANEVLLTKNLLFVRMLGRIYAVDLASHKDVWTIEKSGTLAMSANGVLYITTGDTVIAVNVK